jgi:rubredoxin
VNKDGEAIASPFVFGHPPVAISILRGSQPQGVAAGTGPYLEEIFTSFVTPRCQALWRTFGSDFATYLFDNSCAIRART